jgi:RNA polymerase sigma-70 factor (ECF subfamily)
VDAVTEALVETPTGVVRPDIEQVFRANYARIARVIARVIRDPARAEELAVEVLLKWSRGAKARDQNTDENIEAWLYRVAVRTGLNELRQRARRNTRERLFSWRPKTPTPEETYEAEEVQRRVDAILGALQSRQAELLLLRSQGFSYEQLASALNLNPSSVGTLLSRAQQAFRKEYVRRYEQR